MAPTISPARYTGTWSHGVDPLTARPMVTAGFRCAPLMGPATTTPTNTANAHAAVMTIQPALLDLDFASRTPATTPSPSRISSLVPNRLGEEDVDRVVFHAIELPLVDQPRSPGFQHPSAQPAARRRSASRGTHGAVSGSTSSGGSSFRNPADGGPRRSGRAATHRCKRGYLDSRGADRRGISRQSESVPHPFRHRTASLPAGPFSQGREAGSSDGSGCLSVAVTASARQRTRMALDAAPGSRWPAERCSR